MRQAVPILTLVMACYPGGGPMGGFVQTTADGPEIIWDLAAEPLPEIPFPNDVATRADPKAETGLRLNASLLATTKIERKLRTHMAEIDGWGTFAPISVRFDGRLDVVDVAARQRGDTDFADDAVLLIDVTAASRTYGQAQVLDFGNGSFPATVTKPGAYFDNDPRNQASNILFDTYNEDLDGDYDCRLEDRNGNGLLDRGEDTDGDAQLDLWKDSDGDGACDVPNLWGTVTGDPERLDPYQDLISFYELQTDTLIFRPLYPLEEQTTYAVVLTNRLRGTEGNPIRSPFPYVHHEQQMPSLRPLFEDGLLEAYGLTGEEVSFAWTFTTQSVTSGLVRIREGLHGIGPFAHLSALYPPEVERIVPINRGGSPERYVLPPKVISGIVDLVFSEFDISGFDAESIGPLLDTYGAIDYLVAGDYISPDFLEGGGGVMDINPVDGAGTHAPASLRFVMAIPKRTYGRQPFPVALYCHGYTSLKLEALAFAGFLAKFGIATFVIDAYSHGIPLGPEFAPAIEALIEEFDAGGLTPFYDAVKKDRARDLNADGVVEIGGDFWTNDSFHTRDIVRQTTIDYLQAIRVLQGFDGSRIWPTDINGDGIQNDLAGDYNADGVVDAGGPHAEYYVLGTSMGGILSSIIGALDPAIKAAAPISPGGGLLEVGLRTDLSNVVRAVFLPILGPMVVTLPAGECGREMQVKWMVNDVFSKKLRSIGRIGRENGAKDCNDVVVTNELLPGDIFRVENLTNGEVEEVEVPDNRRVRAHIRSDKGDAIVITVWRPAGPLPNPLGTSLSVDPRWREAPRPTRVGCADLPAVEAGGTTLVKCFDTFELIDIEIEGAFQGKLYYRGDPLVAIQEGLGYRRNSPDLRRLLGVAQTILEPADPVNWAKHYQRPLVVLPEGQSPTNVLFTLTLGDMTVPASTGVALARAAGIIDFRTIDPDYGMSENQLLIDTHVIEAVDELYYFRDGRAPSWVSCCHAHCDRVNFDIDDVSNGLHNATLPRLAGPRRQSDTACGPDPKICEGVRCEERPPLRATVKNGDGFLGARFPAFRARGMHAVDLPNPDLPFDTSMFVLNQIGLFLSTGGRVLSDHPCLADNDCRPCDENEQCSCIVGEPCPTLPVPPTLDWEP